MSEALRLGPGSLAGEVAVPPSKSLLHRAMIAAALAGDPAACRVPDSPSEDVAATRRCLAALLARLSLPTRLAERAESVDPAALMDAMMSDKKKLGAEIRFVLLDRIGACSVVPLAPGTIAGLLPAAL